MKRQYSVFTSVARAESGQLKMCLAFRSICLVSISPSCDPELVQHDESRNTVGKSPTRGPSSNQKPQTPWKMTVEYMSKGILHTVSTLASIPTEKIFILCAVRFLYTK